MQGENTRFSIMATQAHSPNGEQMVMWLGPLEQEKVKAGFDQSTAS